MRILDDIFGPLAILVATSSIEPSFRKASSGLPLRSHPTFLKIQYGIPLHMHFFEGLLPKPQMFMATHFERGYFMNLISNTYEFLVELLH